MCVAKPTRGFWPLVRRCGGISSVFPEDTTQWKVAETQMRTEACADFAAAGSCSHLLRSKQLRKIIFLTNRFCHKFTISLDEIA